MDREAEILRYWVQGSIAATLPGAFTNDASEGAVASRGIIAASASLRPSLRHIAERIQDADDRGALKLYKPVMEMVEGVMKKLFLSNEATGDPLRSACIKFVEIVVLCCSSKAQLTSQKALTRRRVQIRDDFALEDLPEGHPIITREGLESVGEYGFATLRGMVTMGGQVKIDVNVLSDMMLGNDVRAGSSQVVAILKPAALAFLEVESSVMQDDESSPEFNIDRSSVDMDFTLNQKSYILAVNAVSTLATNRPVFYKEAATCLARRTYDPPVLIEGGPLANAGVLAVGACLRSSCMILLRNTLSITTNSCDILKAALEKYEMGAQADKAIDSARNAAALKTAGRAARNRAAMFYEWDDSAADKRVTKRQRETDDDLAKMRAAKAKRGLGHGIQLPSNMVDAIELILLNLSHIPPSRPPAPKNAKERKVPVTLDYVIDAVMSNGASLSHEDGQWYDRDGGRAWSMEMAEETRFELEQSIRLAAEVEHDKSKAAELDEKSKKGLPTLFNDQCHSAASDAFGRIVANSAVARTVYQKEFASKIAAKLACTLQGVQPPKELQSSFDMAKVSATSLSKQLDAANGSSEAIESFMTRYPLVSSCLATDVTANAITSATTNMTSPMSTFVLNEAYLQDCRIGEGVQDDKEAMYEKSLDVYAASVAHASELANDKPSDNDRKRVASQAAASLPQHLGVLPFVTPSSLALLSSLCDVEEISKKAAEAARKSSSQTIATSAAVHAAKVAAEKRATAVLIALRDSAFQRTKPESRKSAVDCAVGIATGRYPSIQSVEDKALKLVMNVMFPKSKSLSDTVVDSATDELQRAADYAIESYNRIEEANKNTPLKTDQHKKHLAIAGSEEEKKALEHVKKPAVLFMALCVRRPEMIKTLMELSCQTKADVLLKAVKANMPKLARAAATKYGAAAVAFKVSEMATGSDDEIPMVLAFLDNLAPSTDKDLPSQDLIDACLKIQESRVGPDGDKDARFIIPVVSGMKRVDLVEKLPEFVAANDNIFLAALERMGDRLKRQALIYRDEPDPENPALHGMTLCEQLVFLHQMDFAAVGLPQKRYLDAIRLCLEDDEVFTDRVVMAALDYISGRFLTTEEKLPLAYMRTIILTCSKHESLHSWICHVLLPRLIEGRVYTDKRQWEGWMRCAKMLENTGDTGVSSLEAIAKLPSEQLAMYRAKYPS
jgi:symplekin